MKNIQIRVDSFCEIPPADHMLTSDLCHQQEGPCREPGPTQGFRLSATTFVLL